jgi:hypothetical protein
MAVSPVWRMWPSHPDHGSQTAPARFREFVIAVTAPSGGRWQALPRKG